MTATKTKVECIGGPADGRTVSVDATARFVAFPVATDIGYGHFHYEIVCGLAFYVAEPTQ